METEYGYTNKFCTNRDLTIFLGNQFPLMQLARGDRYPAQPTGVGGFWERGEKPHRGCERSTTGSNRVRVAGNGLEKVRRREGKAEEGSRTLV
jgi:hypothetical protein